MSNQKRLKAVIILSIALTLPLEGMAIQSMTSFDANGDGQVTDTERKTGLTTLFTTIDTNADTYLALDEMQTWRNAEQVARFNTLDTDKSASLTLAELQTTSTTNPFPEAMSSKIFTLLDADANSVLSWDEYAVLEPGKGELIMHFAHMDTDNDSKISLTEFLNTPAPGDHRGGHGKL